MPRTTQHRPALRRHAQQLADRETALVRTVDPGTRSLDIAAAQDDKFRRLIAQWREETDFSSSVEEKIFHPAYQAIMAKGEVALKYIFKDLEQNGGFWFWALQRITGEDPVLPEDDTKAAREAWLKWGRAHLYL